MAGSTHGSSTSPISRQFSMIRLRVNAFYGGWQDGFLITLDFEMMRRNSAARPIESEPGFTTVVVVASSMVLHQTQLKTTLWQQISTLMQLRKKQFCTSQLLVTVLGGNENCAEFCQKNYYLNVDGNQVAQKLIWKDDCGFNPLHPQGGTWLYDRGGWCPGDRTVRNEHELTQYLSPGSPLEIDIDMQAYTYTGGASFDPNYIMECQLIEFGGANHQNDVEIYNILSPNNDFNYSRFNPVCDAARVVIRNSGAQTLTSCKIVYYVEGAGYNTFDWTGSLEFLETEEVSLPMADPAMWYAWGGPSNKFKVVVSEPNGVADEYEFNNRMETGFEFPPIYGNDIIVWYTA